MGASDVMAVRCDVTKVEDYEALAGKVYGEFGEVAYLHLNAGMGSGFSSFKTPLAEWKLCLDINLYGVINGLHVFAPRMIAQTAPSKILATSSLSGIMNSAPETGIPYVVGKHGVTLTMEYFQHELRQDPAAQHVRAHLLHPGAIRTNFGKNSAALIAGLELDNETKSQPVGGLTMSEEQRRKYEEMTYSPKQLADGLFKRIRSGDFYCIVTPELQPEKLFKAIVGLRAEDMMHDRQPLSQHVP